MTAVSTFRPHSQSAEYACNQIRALQSWQMVFDSVFLIGHPEPELNFSNVTFIDSGERFPAIKDMILLLTQCKGWGCWINCDIVLTPVVNTITQIMAQEGCWASTSQRWTFNPETFDLAKAVMEPNDFGLDIFIAPDSVWKSMYSKIHPGLRKTGMVYDTWITGYLWNTLGKGYRNFTDFKCVFHPRHGGRQRDFQNDVKWIQDDYGRSAGIPPPLIPSSKWNRMQ